MDYGKREECLSESVKQPDYSSCAIANRVLKMGTHQLQRAYSMRIVMESNGKDYCIYGGCEIIFRYYQKVEIIPKIRSL